MNLAFTFLALLVALVGVFYTIKQYIHQKLVKEKDINLFFKPEIKIEPEIKISENDIKNQIDNKVNMNDEYYTKLGVDILRSKKQGDDFNIEEIK